MSSAVDTNQSAGQNQEYKLTRIDVASITVGKRMRPLGDLTSLVESIREVGLLNPILVMPDRHLISGYHRLQACKMLEWKSIPAMTLSVSRQEAKLREIDENLMRNELTVLQRAEHLYQRKRLYEHLHPETRKGGNHGNQYTGGKKCQSRILPFSQTSAQLMRQSTSTVQRLVRIARLLTPETRKVLKGTHWEDNQHVLSKLCSFAPEKQKAIALRLGDRKSDRLSDAFKKLAYERLSRMRCKAPLEGRQYRLLRGDFRDVGNELAPGTVDLILTDAPFSKADLPLFRPLSLFASRVLREGGSLVCLISPFHLPQILQDLTHYLRYHWTIISLFRNNKGLNRNRRVMTGHSLYLWLTKGRYRGRAFVDVIQARRSYDKSFHQYGKSEEECAYLIERLTELGDTVLDCFMGGGTTAVAALALGRRFVGIDQDGKSVQATRKRLEGTLAA